MGSTNQTKRTGGRAGGRDNGDGSNDDDTTATIRITSSPARIIVFLGVIIFVMAGILLESAVLNNFVPSRYASSSSTTGTAAFSPSSTTTTIQPAARTTAAFRCANVTTVDPDQFKAQRGEDKKLLTYFGGLCNGTYVELGALDGVRYSNTYFFNRVLQWKGVLIELGPRNYAKLVRNRPDELAVVQAGVCDHRRVVHYVESGAGGIVGGIVEFAADSFKKYWWTGRVGLSKEQEIECLPMNDLLDDKVGETFYFDFLSLDVEGAEFQVVQTLDFTRYGFGIIVVESDHHDERKNMALRTLLVANGYSQFEPRSDDTDWFVNNMFHSIYADLLHPAAAAAATT